MQSTLTTSPRVWIGHWLMFVALGHTVVAGILFGPALMQVVERGVFNTVGRDPVMQAAVWFLICGAVLALLAHAITALERCQQFATLRILGAGMLALSALGIVLMPTSGFWLVLPAAIALLRR